MAQGRGGRPREVRRGDGSGGTGEVERDDREDEPGGVGGEHPGRQVRQRGVFEVGVNPLDDRVSAVGRVRGDRVEDLGVGAEERVEAPGVEQDAP